MYTNVVLIKTYKLRVYDMLHFSGSTVRLTRCGIQKISREGAKFCDFFRRGFFWRVATVKLI